MSALRVAAVTVVLVVVAACASASSITPRPVHVAAGLAPRLLGAAGWHVLQKPLLEPALGPASAAADFPLAKADLQPGTPVPSHTVASLPRDGVVIWVQFAPRRRSARPNKYFPPTTLPLRLRESVRLNGIPEGFSCPRTCAIRTLEASASGYDISVWIFFGTAHSTAASRTAADRELSRISLPGCPAHPRALTRGDLSTAGRAALAWLRAHYPARARRDLKGDRAATRRLSEVDGDNRFATADALCGERAGRIAAVTIKFSGIGLKNNGSNLLYFLAKAPHRWLVWRQG
jgi:hypothetical protein